MAKEAKKGRSSAIGTWVAIVGTVSMGVLGWLTFIRETPTKDVDPEIKLEVNQLLDEALDIMAGTENAQVIVTNIRSGQERDSIERARRKIDSAQSMYRTARGHYMKGVYFHLAGELDKSIEEYEASIELRPTARAHAYLGCALTEPTRNPTQVDRDKALALFRRAYEMDSEDVVPAYCLGVGLKERGDLQGALDYLNRADQSGQGSFTEPLVMLADVQFELGQKGKAIGTLRKANSNAVATSRFSTTWPSC